MKKHFLYKLVCLILLVIGFITGFAFNTVYESVAKTFDESISQNKARLIVSCNSSDSASHSKDKTSDSIEKMIDEEYKESDQSSVPDFFNEKCVKYPISNNKISPVSLKQELMNAANDSQNAYFVQRQRK